MLRFVVAGMLVLTGLVSVPSARAAVTVDTSASYVLVNQNSGKALDVTHDDSATTTTDESKVDGAKVMQWTRDDRLSQQWQFVDSGSGYYRLKNRNSGKVLDVPSFSTTDGTVLDQWSDTNGTNVQFSFSESSGGLVRLINNNSGKAVSVKDSSTTDGADVVQSTNSDGTNQRWLLVPMNTVDTSTWYTLVNQYSGKALDVADKDPNDDDAKVTHTDDAAKATQWARDDTSSQQWKFVDAGGGYYRLKNRYSGKVLDVPGASTTDGTVLDQSSDSGANNQQFSLKVSSGGVVRLINRNSGKSVAGSTSSLVNGTQVVQSTDSSSAKQQQWLLVPANTIDTGIW